MLNKDCNQFIEIFFDKRIKNEENAYESSILLDSVAELPLTLQQKDSILMLYLKELHAIKETYYTNGFIDAIHIGKILTELEEGQMTCIKIAEG